MSFKQFGWVPDGVYDSRYYLVRYEIKDGNYTTVIAKSWVDQGGPVDISDLLRLQWGTYSDLPPKPVKK